MPDQSRSGLEYLRAMAAGEIAHPTMADTVPMRITSAAEGHVTMHARATERHINTAGSVHGGVFATILDTLTGCAVHTTIEAGEKYTTVELSVKMVAPIPVDEELHGEGRVLHVSKRLAVAEGTIRNAAGKLLAHGTATCLVLRP